MKQSNTILAVLSCLFSFFFSGCAGLVLAGGAAAGAGTYAYINGELNVTENASISKTWVATRAAVQEMNLRIVSENHDALTGRVHAKGAGNKDIYINLKSLSERETEIRIRVGVFGDEVLSERILTHIEKQIGKAAE